MEISAFIEQLQSFGDPERALASRRYHKSSREHWGVPVPICEELIRNLSKGLECSDLIELAKDLWSTNLFDPMICAAKVLSLPRMQASKVLWETLLRFLRNVDGWALEDSLCHVAWKCVLAEENLLDEIEEWTRDSNFWMRRAALVYTLPFAKPKRDPERSLGWASRYASDPEWFIQKAIGWWLRVLGEHNPERVCIFLNAHSRQLKSVARKEATRKLSPKWQQKILQRAQSLAL